MALAHLLGLGHTRIGFVSAPLSRMSRKNLLSGYKQSLRQASIPIDEALIYIDAREDDKDELYDFSLGQRAVERLFQNGAAPTALFCINDIAAVGAIRQLQTRGLRVPEDVSVVGFDNIPLTEMITPTLTTIDQSTYDLGFMSADLLFKNIAPDKSSPLAQVSLQLEPTLVIRNSTGPVASA